MKELLIMLVALVPVGIEVILDISLWKDGRDDKPISTIFRSLLMFAIALAFAITGISTAWQTMVLLAGTHFLFFDYTLNLVRFKKIQRWSYYAEREIFYHLGWAVGLGVKLLVFYSAWATFFHLDWLHGNYPDRLIEFFMF